MSPEQIHAAFRALGPAERFPLPMAYADPAFAICVTEAAGTAELVAHFDRLHGCSVGNLFKRSPIERMVDQATGFADDQMRQFVGFVHDCVYLRLPDEAIHSLRVQAGLKVSDSR